jgi:large subunit ribosomal protein L22
MADDINKDKDSGEATVATPRKRATKRGKAKKAVTGPVLGEATVKHVRMSPRKARLVVDMIRGKQIEPALQILKFSPKKASDFALKALESAIANAHEKGADVDSLWVTGCFVDMGRTLKRFIPAAHGRAVPNYKRAAHFTVQVGTKI